MAHIQITHLLHFVAECLEAYICTIDSGLKCVLQLSIYAGHNFCDPLCFEAYERALGYLTQGVSVFPLRRANLHGR